MHRITECRSKNKGSNEANQEPQDTHHPLTIYKQLGFSLLCFIMHWAMLKNQAYYGQYYAFNFMIMLSEMHSILLFYWLLY